MVNLSIRRHCALRNFEVRENDGERETIEEASVNTKTKRRMVVVTGIIVMVLVVILAVVGGSSSAKPVTFRAGHRGVRRPEDPGQRQRRGEFVHNRKQRADVRHLRSERGASQQLRVRFEGGVSATFGNNVTAICTGKVGQAGVLNCSELVTKCPSKYENATNAFSVAVAGLRRRIVGKPVKVSGVVKDGTLKAAGEGDRFVLVDPETATSLPSCSTGRSRRK